MPLCWTPLAVHDHATDPKLWSGPVDDHTNVRVATIKELDTAQSLSSDGRYRTALYDTYHQRPPLGSVATDPHGSAAGPKRHGLRPHIDRSFGWSDEQTRLGRGSQARMKPGGAWLRASGLSKQGGGRGQSLRHRPTFARPLSPAALDWRPTACSQRASTSSISSRLSPVRNGPRLFVLFPAVGGAKTIDILVKRASAAGRRWLMPGAPRPRSIQSVGGAATMTGEAVGGPGRETSCQSSSEDARRC
ncbi:uncharacterized protein PSFLO_00139 [Pseudozyma flocculosa]|uniref:Uncharacterized protein n=1 Tax=Pseudozyma flocculosa TaxID=84751 RepID=A0A5C3ER39_9BASI|nr:uncharacterized protein PSFLO_00139 [Pseudozyma flocculosa]